MIGPDDSVYCTDDLRHTVRKFTPDGRLLLTLGPSGWPSDTGATSVDYRTILRAGPPFHFPTNLALSPSGEIVRQRRLRQRAGSQVLRPTANCFSRGANRARGRDSSTCRTASPSIDSGTVYVADRENCRLQLFHPDGEFISEWTDIARPCQVFIDGQGDVYVAELGFRAGMWPGTTPPTPDATGGRLSIFDSQGELKARWGGGETLARPATFSRRTTSGSIRGATSTSPKLSCRPAAPEGWFRRTCHTLQKFVRAQ